LSAKIVDRAGAIVELLDRHDAGRRLAAELVTFAGERPVIVALPRGGVPVAFEVALVLGAPLELLAVRKLGATWNPELAVGAVAEDGTVVLDSQSPLVLGMPQGKIETALAREVGELRRRVDRYRAGRPATPVNGRTAIIVDDGLATGLTALAAVRALRARDATRVVVAAPVGSVEAVSRLAGEADRVVCVEIPPRLYGVGMWYRDFEPVSEEQVRALLAQASARGPRWASRPRLVADAGSRLISDGVGAAKRGG
jgi:putative phosphoribosyl transferase